MAESTSKSLAGKTAVVTGASSGIGRSIAIEFAAAGAHVLIHGGHNRSGAEETTDVASKYGVETKILLADFTDEAAIEPFANAAWNWRGHVDIWMNNAGADTLTGKLAKSTYEQKLERLWQIDVLATVRLSRLIGKRMFDRTSGSTIINIGWDQAATGMGGDSGELFATSKGAVMSFSLSLAKTLAPKVRVNCIAPGWVKTAWGEGASGAWQERAMRESLLQRWGRPDDIAKTARFLVSADAEFINGQIINVNGGRP
jgi:3-oxoacyl-[acyl-carrier protein] reductase